MIFGSHGFRAMNFSLCQHASYRKFQLLIVFLQRTSDSTGIILYFDGI